MAHVINVYGRFLFIDPIYDSITPNSIGVRAIELPR